MSCDEWNQFSPTKKFNIIGLFYNTYVGVLSKTNLFDYGINKDPLFSSIQIKENNLLKVPRTKDIS